MTTSLVFWMVWAVAPLELPAVEAAASAAPRALDLAEQKLDAGASLEAVVLLMREQRAAGASPNDRVRLSSLLARAADLLADSGDIKAAAVAADASWQIDGRPLHPRVSLLLGRYAAALRDTEPGAARAIAERALVADPANVAAAEIASSLVGLDTWVSGHLTLGGGVALGLLSSSAFVYGFDVERQIRGGVHERAEVDALLLKRGIAAGVAWPAAIASVVATAVGLALIASHAPGSVAVLPPPFQGLGDE